MTYEYDTISNLLSRFSQLTYQQGSSQTLSEFTIEELFSIKLAGGIHITETALPICHCSCGGACKCDAGYKKCIKLCDANWPKYEAYY